MLANCADQLQTQILVHLQCFRHIVSDVCRIRHTRIVEKLLPSNNLQRSKETGELGFEPKFGGLSPYCNGVELIKKGRKNQGNRTMESFLALGSHWVRVANILTKILPN
jgi:hypothetical protein